MTLRRRRGGVLFQENKQQLCGVMKRISYDSEVNYFPISLLNIPYRCVKDQLSQNFGKPDWSFKGETIDSGFEHFIYFNHLMQTLSLISKHIRLRIIHSHRPSFSPPCYIFLLPVFLFKVLKDHTEEEDEEAEPGNPWRAEPPGLPLMTLKMCSESESELFVPFSSAEI